MRVCTVKDHYLNTFISKKQREKNLACKIWCHAQRSCRSAGSWAVLSQEVTAVELITLLTCRFWERWAHLAAPTTSALWVAVSTQWGDTALWSSSPLYLQAKEHFGVPYFRPGSWKTGFWRKMCEISLFPLTANASISQDSTLPWKGKCWGGRCIFHGEKSQPLVACKRRTPLQIQK